LPYLLALAFAFHAKGTIDRALAGAAVDAHTALRLIAAGLSETMSLDVFGGFVTCGAAIVAAVSSMSAVATIDVAGATRAVGRPPSSVFGAATLVCGAAWFVAAVVLT